MATSTKEVGPLTRFAGSHAPAA